ncbi:tRNA (adenosine(37)-N6)-dimethylallyltransferase MiaA [Patescibacteria group bacterium]|nr:tRNA (adenosine(37)-N6)-dimethylallyltransferase MiaA [Patescibacteria group bacterium]
MAKTAVKKPKSKSVLKNKLIVILGPTACGKTKLAVKLAKLFNGEIVSADSRQVYQGMDIGTGKDLKEYQNIPYHLIDVYPAKKQFTLADYQKKAYQAIDNIICRKKIPFLVGGSGLYLQAVIDGYQLSQAAPDLTLRKNLNAKSLKQLQNLAKNLKLNKSDFNNKRRLIRALEIQHAQKKFKPAKKPKYNCLILGLKFPKKIIDQRIDKRLKARLKQGLIKEVKKLHQQGLSWKKLQDFGLEYKWIAYYLQNKINYEEMTEKLAIAIHQFAKRQMTWYKRMENIIWIKNYTKAKNKIKKALSLSRN